MIKVKFRKPHPRFGYFAGDLGEIDTDNAAKLLKSGHIIVLPDDEGDDEDKGNAGSLPEDIPSRKKLLAMGCDNLEKISLLLEGGKLKDEGFNPSEIGKLKKYFAALAEVAEKEAKEAADAKAAAAAEAEEVKED